MNCCGLPLATDAEAGVMAIDCRTIAAAVTVSVVVDETLLYPAPTVVEPAARAEAMPAGLMVAVMVFEELQVTEVVRFVVEPSE